MRVATNGRAGSDVRGFTPGAGIGPVREDRGFTLLGLLVAVAIINIGLGVAATSWVIIDKRAKEAELIWRGQQYVRALQCHRQQTGGLPDRLDELIDSDCIRALYPDPMNPDGEWHLIRESNLRTEAGARGGTPAFSPDGRSLLFPTARLRAENALELRGESGASFPATGIATPSLPPAQLGTRRGGGAAGGRVAGEQGGQTPTGSLDQSLTQTLQESADRLQGLMDRLRQDLGGGGNGIVGVASFSRAESLRLYDGESTYDAWRFVAQ